MKKRILSLVLCAAMLLSMAVLMGAGNAADTTESASTLQAVNFTNVAPFGPAVTGVSPLRARSVTTLGLDDSTTGSDNGLVTSKTATENGNGKYTITLEAYTTGTVTTETKDVPTDIVLVLDQSGSMADCIVCGEKMGDDNDQHPTGYQEVSKSDISRNSTYYVIVDGSYQKVTWRDGFLGIGRGWYDDNGVKRDPNSYAFYQATGYEACTSRLSALKTALNNFTEAVNKKAAGADGMLGTGDDVNHRIAMVGFASSGSNYNAYEYENTELLIGSNQYGYTSASKYYAKAFQDMRTTKGQNNVVASINALDAYGGTFTNLGVEMANGIFNANQVQSGEQRNRVMVVFTDGLPGTGNYNSSVANSAISQAQTAKNSGVTVYSVGIFSGADATSAGNQNGSETEKANYFMQNVSSNNGTPQNPSYYLSAGDSDSLNSIFEQISNQISSPSISLGSETVVKDVVSPYFDMPANTSDIKVYTQAATAANGTTWADRVQSSLTPTISGSSISVTGFDFNANFVSDNAKSDGTYGKKLIIEFTVTPKAGFLGGNNVPTNGADSGVYSGDKLVENFAVPTVNVPIGDVSVTAANKNVYYGNAVTQEQLLDGAIVECGGVNVNTAEAWQKDFVTISSTTTAITEATADVSYTVTAKVSPKYTGTVTEKSGSVKAEVNVYKPEITYQDSVINLGDTANYENNFVSTVWKHGEQTSTDDGVIMVGTAPELTYTYNPEAGKFTQDTYVNVTVMANGNALPDDAVTFQHKDNDCKFPGCSFNREQGQFIVHINVFDLTIQKTAKNGSTIDPNQTFVFKVKNHDTGKTMEVVITGTGSKKITGLPVGSYTVTEDTKWSWQYKPDDTTQNVTIKGTTAEVTFTNTYEKSNWLTSFYEVINKWITNDDGTAGIEQKRIPSAN